jgi:aminopeptidase-like protein
MEMEIGIQVIDWLIPHEWGTEIVIPSGLCALVFLANFQDKLANPIKKI